MKRYVRKNPKDEELLNKLRIEKETGYTYGYNESWIHYKVFLNNKMIGDAQYLVGKDYISTVYVDREYRRKGVASFLYDYIEKDQNVKLKSDASTREGKAFWSSRIKKNPMKKKTSSKRKVSCKCKSPSSLRKCVCSPRRKNPLDSKLPTRQFRNLDSSKFYVFDIYSRQFPVGRENHWGKPRLIDSSRFIVESNGTRTLHYWEDILNVYGPFTTESQAIKAWKDLLEKGYL